MILKDFNNKHLGDTVFITGDSPQLAELSNKQIEKMNQKITISCNYSHMVYNPTYWIAGHIFHTLYAINFCSPKTIKFFSKGTQVEHLEWIFDKGDEDKIILILCSYEVDDMCKVTKDNGSVFGCMNIGMTATGLAYIMGVKRIIYLGVDQKNSVHFYDINKKYKNQMLKNIPFILSKYKYKNKQEYTDGIKESKIILDKIYSGPNSLSMKMEGYENNLCVFSQCFNKLKEDNIEVISTIEDSILIEAGAKFIPLDELL